MDTDADALKKKRYTQISRFLLDERTAEPRNDVHEILFEIGLYSNLKLKKWLTLDEVRDSIAHEIGLRSFPAEPLRRAIPRLTDGGRIKTDNEGSEVLYSLAEERRTQIHQYVEEAKGLHESIVTDLIGRITKEIGDLTKKDVDAIQRAFEHIMSSIFAAIENTSTMILMGDKGITEDSIVSIPAEFNKHIRMLRTTKLKRAVSGIIRDMILRPSKGMRRYFLLSAHSSFMIRLLNLDPECQALQRSVFSDIILFLDTNVLISAMFSTHEWHEMTCEVLEESAQLGVGLKITSRTMDELEKVILRADMLYSKLKGKSKSKFYIPEDTIIETFVRHREAKGDTWETYLLTVKRQQAILEKKFNVEFDQTEYGDFIDGSKLSELSKIVKRCSQVRLVPKSEDVAEHDAYHFLVVDYLRSSHDKPHAIWFLSHDRTFDCVNRGYSELEGKKLPNSLMCTSWMEILFPFLSPDVSEERYEEIFMRFMASDFFSMTRTVSFGNLTRFFVPFFEDEYLDEEDFTIILQNQILNRILKEWRESDYSPEFDEKIARIIAELVDERKDKRLREMELKLDRTEREIEAMSHQIAEESRLFESSEKEDKTRLAEKDEEMDALSKKVGTERKRRVRNRRLGELFIGLLCFIVTVLLLAFSRPSTVFAWLAIMGGGVLVCTVFLGIYRWLTR